MKVEIQKLKYILELMNDFELRPTDKKDHYRFFINGVDVTPVTQLNESEISIT